MWLEAFSIIIELSHKILWEEFRIKTNHKIRPRIAAFQYYSLKTMGRIISVIQAGWFSLKGLHIPTRTLSCPITTRTVSKKFPKISRKFAIKFRALLPLKHFRKGNFSRFEDISEALLPLEHFGKGNFSDSRNFFKSWVHNWTSFTLVLDMFNILNWNSWQYS